MDYARVVTAFLDRIMASAYMFSAGYVNFSWHHIQFMVDWEFSEVVNDGCRHMRVWPGRETARGSLNTYNEMSMRNFISQSILSILQSELPESTYVSQIFRSYI